MKISTNMILQPQNGDKETSFVLIWNPKVFLRLVMSKILYNISGEYAINSFFLRKR